MKSKFYVFVSIKWNRFNYFINFLITLCGAVTAVFSCYAAINSNEISKRSFANEERSAQPIITSFIKNDTLNVKIEKEYRGLNFVEVKPMLTFFEGFVHDQSLTSMKSATFLFQGSKKYATCLSDDENGFIKCHESELNKFFKKVNDKIQGMGLDSGKMSFRNLRVAYLLNVSYIDIFNNKQRQLFIVNSRGRQRSISDSLYKERFLNTDRLTMADTTEETIQKFLKKLEQTENIMMPHKE